nr:hypothetical protein [Oceanococcus sp. HetDA_MAG_MS8]
MYRMLKAMCFAAACAGAPAYAAEVGSGTLTLSTMDLSFGGGPIVGTNATNAAGPDCIDPVLPCDQYALSADLPEDLNAFFPTALIRVTLGPTQNLSGADDYDLRLLDGSGNVLGESTSATANEAVSTIAFGGERDYTVEVIHWLVVGGSYEANIELSLGQPSADKTDEEIAAWFAENGGDEMAESRAMESCTAPGLILLTDASGDVDPLDLTGSGFPISDLDLTELSVFQTGSTENPEDPALIGFRFKLESLTQPIPGSAIYASFSPGASQTVFGVRMAVDQQGAVSFFSYVAGANNDGGVDGRFVEAGSERPANSASTFDASGEVVIFVRPQDIGLLNPGETLTGFNAATTIGVSDPVVGVGVAGTADTMPNGLSRSGIWTFMSDEECAADAEEEAASRSLSSAVNGGGSLPLMTVLFGLLLLGRRRS